MQKPPVQPFSYAVILIWQNENIYPHDVSKDFPTGPLGAGCTAAMENVQ